MISEIAFLVYQRFISIGYRRDSSELGKRPARSIPLRSFAWLGLEVARALAKQLSFLLTLRAAR